MSIIATGAKTIVDLSDGKSLSVYLGCNQPKVQVYDPNPGGSISPDWTQVAGKPVITPVIYVNQTALSLSATGLSITWKRREGNGSETALTTNETVSGNILTVSENKLTAISSALLTYLAYVSYTDPDTGSPINAVADITFSQVKTGINAKLVWISGEQVFKYDTLGAVTPAQITLTANISNVTIDKWQYHNGTAWTDYPTTADNASITGTTLNVKPTHAVFVNDAARLQVLTSEAGVTDEMTLVKVRDAAQTSISFLSNENITFAANASGQVSATTVYCNVVAYTGTTKVTPTVGTVTGAVTGMTVTKDPASNNEIPVKIVIASSATLGGTGQQSGTLTVPITAPVVTNLYIRWSKVNTGLTGATGATGAAGANSVVFSVYAPNGSVFVNQTGTLTIQTVSYSGTNPVSGTYVWKKYTSGSWNTISGQTASSLTVSGADVVGIQAYKCEMTYSGSVFSDTITLTDKTDNYQAVIESTSGDVFKNTVGETCLICRLWQNGTETDGLKAVYFSVTAPSSPASGDFYYKVTTSTPQTALMRYNGSTWSDVTADPTYMHEKTYEWYRRDKDGNDLDGGAAFATGKVIYVNGDDVTDKTTFTCEVS